MTGRVAAVNLGIVTEAGWAGDASGRSGIDKRPVDGPVSLLTGGVAGDFIGERAHHGGPDQAVYAYAEEDAAWWVAELGRAVPPGGFGENLTTYAVDVTGAVIGEQWQVGFRPAPGHQAAHPLHHLRRVLGRTGSDQAVHRPGVARGLPAGPA